MQYGNAVAGDNPPLPNPMDGAKVVHVRDNNRVTAKAGSISSPRDLKDKTHSHSGAKTPFKN